MAYTHFILLLLVTNHSNMRINCGILTCAMSIGGVLSEDFCGVEPVTHPPEAVETRPPPDLDLQHELDLHNTDEAILGS